MKLPKLLYYIRPLVGPLLLAGLALCISSAFFLKAYWETSSLNIPFAEGPLLPLLLLTLLLILLLTIAFASLQAHIYWLHSQEDLAVDKSSFVRMASDTLRTPLTGLSWMTELMLGGDLGTISDAQKESINNMDDAIQRLISLVNELLEVMKISGAVVNYHPRPTDVAILIKDTVEDMRSVAGTKRLHIGYGQISHDVLIMMDEPLIRHVLGTLLAGAIHLAKIDTTMVMHAEPTLEKIAIGITYTGPKIEFKNIDSHEKSIQKSGLPINIGNLDLALSWEILNAAKGQFWTVDKYTEHTLFIGLPLLEAPKGSTARKSHRDHNVERFLSTEETPADASLDE
jgi:K+-sensing histidine kinase KdpD